jgi:hypothetical protein
MASCEQREIDRREALRRAARLLGGVLSAPTIAGVLAGCGSSHADATTFAPRALSSEQLEGVATIADLILPETDTPGARSVGVHQFIDTMLAEYYTALDRQRFLTGLADVDARAQKAGGRPFLRCSGDEQRAIIEALDRETYAASGAPFFRTFKELTLVGYYTSHVGATQELKYARVPGRFEGCVPMTTVGRAWSV